MDEIYTALGTTGKLFCFEHFGVIPDFITMSKTLGSGVPMSALVTTEDIARSFTDTFSGIAPAHAPGFIAAQLVGAASATLVLAWLLYPSPAEKPVATQPAE